MKTATKTCKPARTYLAPTLDDLLTGFRLDVQDANARIDDLAAAEADLAHDVAQAASNPDVVAALTPADDDMGCDIVEIDYGRTESPRPTPLFYSTTLRGVTWAGHTKGYGTYIEADAARASR